jgi:hypothetical protein
MTLSLRNELLSKALHYLTVQLIKQVTTSKEKQLNDKTIKYFTQAHSTLNPSVTDYAGGEISGGKS